MQLDTEQYNARIAIMLKKRQYLLFLTVTVQIIISIAA
jgi:hypothetical protein